MGNRYVNVVITRQTQPTSQDGFGKPLILATNKTAAYKEYTDLADIGTDFDVASKAYKVASAVFSQNPRPATVGVYGVVYDAATGVPTDLSTALNTLITTNNDFFYLLCPEQGDAEITELANWAGGQKKLYFASTSNKTLAATLDNQNVALLVHDTPTSYPAESWVGLCAPQTIGSFTWTFKTLNGISPATYSDTDITTIEENNASTYIKEGGVNITSKGVTTSGEYIDIMQGQYFIESSMTANVYGLLVNTPKIPFTDGGIALIVAEVEKTLKDAAQMGIIATDKDGNPIYTVTAPKAADVSDVDKTNRKLPNVNWTCTVAGAVEDVDVNGVLQI